MSQLIETFDPLNQTKQMETQSLGHSSEISCSYSQDLVLNKQIFSEEGDPTISNVRLSACGSGSNSLESIKTPKGTRHPPNLAVLLLFPESQPVSPCPHPSFVWISSKAKEGLFSGCLILPCLLLLQIAFHSGESFIRLHAQDCPSASTGASFSIFIYYYHKYQTDQIESILSN